MKVGDLVRDRRCEAVGIIVKLEMRLYVPAAVVLGNWSNGNEALIDIEDLELVNNEVSASI